METLANLKYEPVAYSRKKGKKAVTSLFNATIPPKEQRKKYRVSFINAFAADSLLIHPGGPPSEYRRGPADLRSTFYTTVEVKADEPSTTFVFERVLLDGGAIINIIDDWAMKKI